MARQIVPQVENNFIKGLITEGNALNFPQNACTDLDNIQFSPGGDIYRRPGLDYEVNYSNKTVSRSGNAMSTYTWFNPAGQDKTVFVIQIGRYIHLYNVGDASISSGSYVTALDMDSLKTDTANNLAQNECSFACGQGYLFAAHPYCKPFYIAYNSGADTFSINGIDVKVRDTDGVLDETGYNYDTRTTSITDAHRYNLYNQGWFPPPLKTARNDPNDYTDFIYKWRSPSYYWGASGWTLGASGRTDYPSNSDIWWTLINANGQFSITLADLVKRGSTPAPKGYFIMDAWNMDRVTASTITVGSAAPGGELQGFGAAGTVVTLPTVPSTTSGTARPSSVAFHAGRVFYAGTAAQNYSNKIFFTQVIKSEEQFGKCHQLNDPTNQYLFDLLATDGGTVVIPDMGTVVKLFSIQNSLLVFATNGIWVIGGNQGIGFSAGDYTVRRVSSIPSVDPHSFVDVEGLPCWWNYDGIYMVTEVNNAGGLNIKSLTQNTIKTYYTETIPASAKPYVIGSYNQVSKEIRWLWRSAAVSTFEQNYEYDRCLTYHTSLDCFYPWSFDTSIARIVGVASLKTRGTRRQTVSGSRTDVTTLRGSVDKYLISSTDGTSLTFGEIKDATNYVDFKTVDGVGKDFTSYLITGYSVDQGGAARRSQANYVMLFVKYQDNPQFTFQGVYDFGNASDSMRWGTAQTVSFPELGSYDYQVRKLKIRGTGRSIQFRIASISGKPFNLSGWSRWQTSNTSV